MFSTTPAWQIVLLPLAFIGAVFSVIGMAFIGAVFCDWFKMNKGGK